ncbi:ceramide synthase 1-like isoform X2 [Brienomyrus brachyistius]|nr:ceramide synthase 1-like isoform X2 [Brienomyrus brachyistius]
MEGASVRAPEPPPGFSELISRGYAAMLGVLQDCGDCGVELSRRTLLENAHITWTEIGLFAMCAVMWTALRLRLARCLFKPMAEWCCLLPKDAEKMPESVWKLMFYCMSWSYSTYLLFFTQYSFFHDPPSVFYGWKSGMLVPTDIAIAYLIQGSFYAHSIYATFYMDAWRKDSIVMIVHHIITLALISFSYAFRYHNIGLLVLFLHDINDIQLEFTKLNVYLKTRGGTFHTLNDVLSSVGFISFGATWFWFRLYWFPLKVLYASCISSVASVPNIPFYIFFNSLLLALLVMNIYWFLYIVQLILRVLKGQMAGVSDVREYEGEECVRSRPKGHDGNTEQHGAGQKGNQATNGIVKEKQT